MSPDERLETYVQQHDIVDIEFDPQDTMKMISLMTVMRMRV
jgi:hypothetical protein